MFGWVIGLVIAAADPSCDADASSGAALVLPSEAAHVVIRVDDLEDRLAADAADKRVPLSRAAQCVPSSSEHPKGTGSCTLRAALELSATAAEKTAVTLALRSGRFLLAAPLPEVVGTVQLVGTAASEGGSLPALPHGGGGDDGASAPPDEDAPPGSGEGAGDGGDTVADGIDPHWVPPPHEGAPGCTSPVGTVLDGGGQHQILRAARTSALHLMTVRLENGRGLPIGGSTSSRLSPNVLLTRSGPVSGQR